MNRLWLILLLVLFLTLAESAPPLRMTQPAECFNCLMVYHVEWSTNLTEWHFAFRYEGAGDYGNLDVQYPMTHPFRFYRTSRFFKTE